MSGSTTAEPGKFVAEISLYGVWAHAFKSHVEGRQSADIDKILSQDKKHYAIPHSEITQLRVKLPGTLTKGRVTLTTAQGEKVFKINNRGVGSTIKDDWEFLKSPPPKLARKLVVDNPEVFTP